MPHFPLSCFPTPYCRLKPFGDTMGGAEAGAAAMGIPCSCCSLCPIQLLQHGLFHWSSSHWMLYLPWTCLFLFSIPCPFLNTFPWRRPNLTWFVQFWGTMGQFFSGTKPGVSSTLTRQSNIIFLQACHHALSMTCFPVLLSSGVTCYGKLSSIFSLHDLPSPCEMNTIIPHKVLTSLTGLYTSMLHLSNL